jgi:precorrin-4/cobalt-precorrin-4 C11-methyltransferase
MRETRRGKVFFIGAGPGDPELLTIKGQRLIASADLVLYADSLVSPEVVALARPNAEVLGSASLTLEQIVERMLAAVEAGLTVARVHSGDPALYGALHEQLVALEAAGVEYEIVPGVSSVFAAASELHAELTVPGLAQTVILTRLPGRTETVEGERLAELARHGATMAIFLSVTAIQRVVEELRRGGYPAETPAAVVYRATWPDQELLRGTLADIAALVHKRGLKRQALILVGQALDPAIRQLAAAQRSGLYRASHPHLFRPAGS